MQISIVGITIKTRTNSVEDKSTKLALRLVGKLEDGSDYLSDKKLIVYNDGGLGSNTHWFTAIGKDYVEGEGEVLSETHQRFALVMDIMENLVWRARDENDEPIEILALRRIETVDLLYSLKMLINVKKDLKKGDEEKIELYLGDARYETLSEIVEGKAYINKEEIATARNTLKHVIKMNQ